MAINTDIATISQNAALNGPTGSDPVSTGDDAIRYALSFIAKLRDGVGYTAGAIVAGLGFTPTRQGGLSSGSAVNTVSFGYNAGLARLVCAVDANQFSNRWPIDVDGPARSVRSGGAGVEIQFDWTATGATPAYAWCTTGGSGNSFVVALSSLSVGSATNATNATNATTAASCSGNAATATTASNSNALGGVAAASYVQKGPGNCVTVEGPRNTGVTGRAIPNTDSRVNYFSISGSDLIVEIDGTTFAIQKSTPSDERLKKNIRPTVADSAAEIDALDFKAFDYTDLATLFGGQSREVGVIAQQAEKIRPGWVKEIGEYKQLDTEAMLMSALHAIQQQGRTIAALTARVEALEAAK